MSCIRSSASASSCLWRLVSSVVVIGRDGAGGCGVGAGGGGERLPSDGRKIILHEGSFSCRKEIFRSVPVSGFKRKQGTIFEGLFFTVGQKWGTCSWCSRASKDTIIQRRKIQKISDNHKHVGLSHCLSQKNSGTYVPISRRVLGTQWMSVEVGRCNQILRFRS